MAGIGHGDHPHWPLGSEFTADAARFCFDHLLTLDNPCGSLCVGDAIHLSWKPEHTLVVEIDAAPGDVIAEKESA